MAQKFIKGQEATCGVLEISGAPIALPPTRILPNFGEFYDYKSKYQAGGSQHICPADFDAEINTQIQKLAIMAHKALGCRSMSRTDIFVDGDLSTSPKPRAKRSGSGQYGAGKKLYILETNTIPGMTPTSLFPEAAAKAGVDFNRMLDYIINASIK